MSKSGELKYAMEVEAPASKLWDLMGTPKLAKLVVEKLPTVLSSAKVIEGDGGSGTLVKCATFTERYNVVDNVNRFKEIQVVEGGYLNHGFTLFRYRFQIVDKIPDKSCLLTASIYYELPRDNPNDRLISIDSLVTIAHLAKDHVESPPPPPPPTTTEEEA